MHGIAERRYAEEIDEKPREIAQLKRAWRKPGEYFAQVGLSPAYRLRAERGGGIDNKTPTARLGPRTDGTEQFSNPFRCVRHRGGQWTQCIIRRHDTPNDTGRLFKNTHQRMFSADGFAVALKPVVARKPPCELHKFH